MLCEYCSDFKKSTGRRLEEDWKKKVKVKSDWMSERGKRLNDGVYRRDRLLQALRGCFSGWPLVSPLEEGGAASSLRCSSAKTGAHTCGKWIPTPI